MAKTAKKAKKASTPCSVVETIIDMRRHCFTIKDIAKSVHKGDRYVSKVLRLNRAYNLGIDQVIIGRMAGESIKDIARSLGISDRIVAKVVRMHCRKSV